jgi:hypothetical protein
MMAQLPGWLRSATLLAINLLYLMVWGFAALGKLQSGVPDWFAGKFGSTLLARVPGLAATFWILALSEALVAVLAAVAFFRLEFRGKQPPVLLGTTLVGSLFVFLQLGFGQWLTNEFAGAFQQFVYFGLTLVALHTIAALTTPATIARTTGS